MRTNKSGSGPSLLENYDRRLGFRPVFGIVQKSIHNTVIAYTHTSRLHNFMSMISPVSTPIQTILSQQQTPAKWQNFNILHYNAIIMKQICS